MSFHLPQMNFYWFYNNDSSNTIFRVHNSPSKGSSIRTQNRTNVNSNVGEYALFGFALDDSYTIATDSTFSIGQSGYASYDEVNSSIAIAFRYIEGIRFPTDRNYSTIIEVDLSAYDWYKINTEDGITNVIAEDSTVLGYLNRLSIDHVGIYLEVGLDESNLSKIGVVQNN